MTPWDTIATSCHIFRTEFLWQRLFVESPGVKGPCSGFKDPDNPEAEVAANVIRILFTLFVAPAYLICRPLALAVVDFISVAWLITIASTPHAVLFSAFGTEKYEVAHLMPKWVLQVIIKNGMYQGPPKQILWTENVTEFTALSYAMNSAWLLFCAAGHKLQDPEWINGRQYTLRDRRRIAEMVLIEYVAGRPDGVEYVWLDEFCLSDDRITSEELVKKERDEEVGRLADIFRAASYVCVFCHVKRCNHTSPVCPWGTRIFTLTEILHAKNVLTITVEEGIQRRTTEMTGDLFRAKMREQAEWDKRWHLYAIMQHITHAGSVPWQVAIHALVVETIRRDLATGFPEHKYVGKALNGLLPRRARLTDLHGQNGWDDLAWLLELNQCFYNAAGLAAVCCVDNRADYGHSWLGRPLDPAPGNERLEPIVNAFPVREGNVPAALNIINSRTIGVSNTLTRDLAGLYHNPEIRGIMWLAFSVLLVFWIAAFSILRRNPQGFLVLLYMGTVLYCAIELAVGTMYLVKDGWVLLNTTDWGPDPRITLGKEDNTLRHLTSWGRPQLAPEWQQMEGSSPGHLVDLKHRILGETFVTAQPNAMVPLAVHGSGITCMLLDRPFDTVGLARKVGMANLPSYVLAQGFKSGSLCVG
jgi:hypothetical protein